MVKTLDKILAVLGGKTTNKPAYKGSKPAGIGYITVEPYLDEFIESIDKERLGIDGIVLYGSIARGEGRKGRTLYSSIFDKEGSDVNLLFISKDNSDYEMYNDVLEKADKFRIPLEEEGLSNFSPRLMTWDEFNDYAKVEHEGITRNGTCRRGGFMYNVADEGKVLYDADGRITKYLKHMQEEPHQKRLFVFGIASDELYPAW